MTDANDVPTWDLVWKLYRIIQKNNASLFNIQSKLRDGENLNPDVIYAQCEAMHEVLPYLSYADVQLPKGSDVFGKLEKHASAPPPPDAEAMRLGAELVDWAADETNALDMFENYSNGHDVWWCNFCSGDLSYESKDEIEHSPNCLHLRAKAIVSAKLKEER